MIEAYKKFWKGYVDFTGCSTPSDYWFACSAHVLIFLCLFICSMECLKEYYLQQDQWMYLLFQLFYYSSFLPMVLSVLPSIALTVRRLRDAGYHWPYIFVPFIPFVGWIIPNYFAM